MSSNDHLSEEELVLWICRELSFAEKLIADRHLAQCWRCRLCKDDLEGPRADRVMSLYRMHIANEDEQLDVKDRERFIERLQLLLQATEARSGWRRQPKRFLSKVWSITLPQAAGMMLGVGSAVFLGWWQQRVPRITSSELLVRAEQSSGLDPASRQGVVYQSIRISSADQTIHRFTYRDMQGKRREREVKLAAKEGQLKRTLVGAGLDWDQPISASDYRAWHDHQRLRSDTIIRAGRHLLKLTTTVPEGSVSEQTLTVRDTDFHPVERTVALRHSGNIEIAELDYKVLPWNAVDAGIFEPDGGDISANGLHQRRVPVKFPASILAPLLDNQIDEAELGARLVLNELHADTGEQIEIARSSDGVEVRGLVETPERKLELQSHLHVVPHLMVSLQSLEDLNDRPVGGAAAVESAGRQQSEPSPLEGYLLPKGDDLDAVNALAHRLFESVLAVSQESKAIEDLQRRFDPAQQKTVIASATSLQLIYSHRERLLAALSQEREALRSIRAGGSADVLPAPSEASLAADAERNLNLYRELTQDNKASMRSALQIVADMSITVADLTVQAHESVAKIATMKGSPAGNGHD